MNDFLDSAKSPKLNKEDLNNLIRPMTNEQLKPANQQSAGPDGFTEEFYQTFGEDLQYRHTSKRLSTVTKVVVSLKCRDVPTYANQYVQYTIKGIT